MKFKFFFQLLYLLSLGVLSAQDNRKLSLDEVYTFVVNNHPESAIYQYQVDEAHLNLMQKRGAFDPKINLDWANKNYQKINYYELRDHQLSIPLKLGSINMGYEDNWGNFLNPENKTPANGLAYLGIKIPLLKNLWIDEQRFDLRNAQININAAEQRAFIDLNQLLYEASKSYWKWYYCYEKYAFNQKGYQLANNRFLGLKRSVENGESAAIDTVEAKIALSKRKIQLNDALMDLENAINEMEVFLWNKGNYIYLKEYQPEYQQEDWVLPTDTLISKHPYLLHLQLEQQRLEQQKKWRKNQLLPEFNLSYHVLNETPFGTSSWNNTLFSENYKWGFQFSFTLFTRKERAALKINEIKLKQNQLEQKVFLRKINAELNIALRQKNNLLNNLVLQKQIVDDYEKLVQAEKKKFDMGESSLFLLIVRENNMIEAQINLVKSRTESQIQSAKIKYLQGLLIRKIK